MEKEKLIDFIKYLNERYEFLGIVENRHLYVKCDIVVIEPITIEEIIEKYNKIK